MDDNNHGAFMGSLQGCVWVVVVVIVAVVVVVVVV
jgi:hypothetical protein